MKFLTRNQYFDNTSNKTRSHLRPAYLSLLTEMDKMQTDRTVKTKTDCKIPNP